ncbi:MipA/OmpV family protein [Yoonia sp. MH D7]
MRILVLPLIVAATSVGAQDAYDARGLGFTLGLGAASKPEYFGSADSNVGPSGSFSLDYLNFGPFSYAGGEDAGGFRFKGSVGYIGERKAADYPELAGQDDVDMALEVGGGFAYSTDMAEIYAVGRYGVIGHEAYVGEVGADLILQPSAQMEMRFGPRLFFGDDSYTETYFGTGAGTAKGGLLSRGVEASISYNFSDNWGVMGTVNYDELLNDAADSPIVQDTDQLGVSVVVTRKLSWTF